MDVICRDTASSRGILKKLPPSAEHVCIFRHALALDERRIKFIPATAPPPKVVEKESDEHPTLDTNISIGVGIGLEKRKTDASKPFSGVVGTGQISRVTKNVPNIKEVWFPGNHVDM